MRCVNLQGTHKYYKKTSMALFVVKNLILLLKEMDLLFLSENMLNRKYIIIQRK